MLPIRWELPTDAEPIALLGRELHSIRIAHHVQIDAAPLRDVGDRLVEIKTVVRARRSEARAVYQALLYTLVRLDLWCRRKWQFPSVLDGDIEFELEPVGKECFRTTPAIFVRGNADCEDLGCDRVAELNLQGVPCTPRLVLERETANLRSWHVDIIGRDGRLLEDPARELQQGMTWR